MDYTDYVSSYGLDPSYFTDTSGQPIANNSGSSGSSNSGFNWSGLGSSLVTGGTNVLTQALKNQGLGNQAKVAKAQATASSATERLLIIAAVGLVIVGVIFAFLRGAPRG